MSTPLIARIARMRIRKHGPAFSVLYKPVIRQDQMDWRQRSPFDLC